MFTVKPSETNYWPKTGAVILGYSLLTLAVTYPVVRQLPTAVAGFSGRDSFQHIWYQWWLKEALLELAAWPNWVTALYYPLVINHPVLALHPYVPLTSLPLTLVLGPLISYNLAFLLSFILSGLSGYLLCRYLCRHNGAALIGGLIFAFYPNRMGHAAAGHLLLVTNYFLPLYALSLLILLRRPSARIILWHGIITVMLALTQPTHIGYGIIPIFLFLVGGHFFGRLTARFKPPQPASPRHSPSPLRLLASLMAAGVVSLIIFWPFAWPIWQQSQQNDLTYLTPANLTEHSSDLLAFILPSPYHPLLLWLGWTPSFSSAIINSPRDLEEQLAYPGIIALGLVSVGLWRRRSAGVWFALTLACALFSLGPQLKIAGGIQPVWLPYHWLVNLPFFNLSRTPGRFNETVMLGVAVLAALGAAALFEWLARKEKMLTFSLLVLITLEYLIIFPFPVDSHAIPAYYSRLAQEKLAGGVLEMPVTGSRRASNYAMYYQTLHQYPLAGGYIERDPPGTVELKEFLNQLLSPLPAQTVFTPPGAADRQAILADMRIERVVVHPALMTDQAGRAMLSQLPQLLPAPLFADETIQVYPVLPDQTGHLPGWQFLPDAENWEVTQNGKSLRLKESGSLFIYAAVAGPINLILHIQNPAISSQLTLRLNETPPQILPLESTGQAQTIPLSLSQGFNYLRLSPNPTQNLDFLSISSQPVGRK